MPVNFHAITYSVVSPPVNAVQCNTNTVDSLAIPPTPSQEESDTSMTVTSRNQDEFILPNANLVAEYFRANDYKPLFLSGFRAREFPSSVLIGASALNICADTLNEKLNWSITPQGNGYWKNVTQNLRSMEQFITHSFLHDLDPDTYNRINDPISNYEPDLSASFNAYDGRGDR